MSNSKKISLVALAVLLGLVSGWLSTKISFDLISSPIKFAWFLPGFLFGITLYLVFKFLLSSRVSLWKYLVFMIGSTISYYLAFLAFVPAIGVGHSLETGALIMQLILTGLVGGVGICVSFLIVEINSLRENIILVSISVLVCLAMLMPTRNGFNSQIAFICMLWQGPMMGALAYFTIRKMEKQNTKEIQHTSL